MKYTISGFICSLAIIFACLFVSSCKRKNSDPVLSTAETKNITTTTALSGGNVKDEGSISVAARGVCWNQNGAPTINDSKTTETGGPGVFESLITGLTPGTKYYVRAYASNGAGLGLGYGNEVSFTTGQIYVPTVSNSVPISLTLTSASVGANVTDEGGSPVTKRGICWSTTAHPTITSGNSTYDTYGSGFFSSTLTGLFPGVAYFVRSYATNAVGTGYGNEVQFTLQVLQPKFNSGLSYSTVADADGNNYKTIVIGSQIWMAENLKATRYNDNTDIALVSDNSSWAALTTPAYCYYNNDATTFRDNMGALYNWFAVSTGKLCPAGWHVPSDTEWTALVNYLGGDTFVSGNMKETGLTHWNDPNLGATNSSGFTALPAGFHKWDGTFNDLGNIGYWWSSTEYAGDATMAWYSDILHDFFVVERIQCKKQAGFPVRCIKD